MAECHNTTENGSHLPECFMREPCGAPGSHQIVPDVGCWKCGYPCICDRLRQAEQRGMRSSHRGRTMYAHGYAAGVQAARDAVAALDPDWSRSNEDGIGGILNGVAFTRGETFTYYVKRDKALAAIDALRGDTP